MSKSKIYFLLIPLFLIGISSCKKDDSSTPTPAASLEGKWQNTKEGEITNNQEVLRDYDHTKGCTKDYIEFLKDGIVKDHYFEDPNCKETINSGTWTKNGNIVATKISNQPDITLEIITLTNTTLKVKFQFLGQTFLGVYTKI